MAEGQRGADVVRIMTRACRHSYHGPSVRRDAPIGEARLREQRARQLCVAPCFSSSRTWLVEAGKGLQGGLVGVPSVMAVEGDSP